MRKAIRKALPLVCCVIMASGLAAGQAEPKGETLLPAFPRAGEDIFPVSIAQIGIDLTLDGIVEGDISAEGPFVVVRQDPRPEGGVNVIDVEIVQMELTGSSPLGPVTIRESNTRRSTGQIRARQDFPDFPADSFFDVFVEIELGDVRLENRDPIRMEAVITEIPPRISVYRSLQDPIISLYLSGTQQLVALLLHVAHAPNPDFPITLRDLKILIERVQLKVDLVSAKLDALERTQTAGLASWLLFPFNVSGGGFETGIAITNITNNFFGFGSQQVTGGVEFLLYPSNNPGQPIAVASANLVAMGLGAGLDAQGRVPPGGTMTVLVVELLRAAGVSGPFSGQILAHTQFPAAQGVNFISDSNFSRQSQGYPAVVLK